MLTVSKNGKISLTRGDTARLTVDITIDVDGSPYVIGPEDILTLTAKRTFTERVPAIQLTVTGSNRFCIRPEDTAGLAFGLYKYDVQLTTAEGDVYTVLGPCDLELLKEVTC